MVTTPRTSLARWTRLPALEKFASVCMPFGDGDPHPDFPFPTRVFRRVLQGGAWKTEGGGRKGTGVLPTPLARVEERMTAGN